MQVPLPYRARGASDNHVLSSCRDRQASTEDSTPIGASVCTRRSRVSSGRRRAGLGPPDSGPPRSVTPGSKGSAASPRQPHVYTLGRLDPDIKVRSQRFATTERRLGRGSCVVASERPAFLLACKMRTVGHPERRGRCGIWRRMRREPRLRAEAGYRPDGARPGTPPIAPIGTAWPSGSTTVA